MKKKLLIPLMLCITLIISCSNNNTDKKVTETNEKNTTAKAESLTPPDICEGIDDVDICEKAGGIANLIIEQGYALRLTEKFIADYRRDDSHKPIHALDSIYWVEKQVWLDIAKYITTTLNTQGKPKYDGIRIYMSCNLTPNAVEFPNQQYKHKSGIFIFPTIYEYTPDLKKTDHKDDLVKITLSSGNTSPYIQEASVANPKITKFNEIYRRMLMPLPSQKDNFSKSIWIDSCVVSTLAKLLKLPNANLDGVNINMAAYEKYEPARVPSMLYANQSTALLVPSSLARGKHINNWAIVNCLHDKFKLLYLAPPPGGLNHGELCPQVCN
jgi:hypothetical protein